MKTKRYILILLIFSLFARVSVSQDTNKDKFYQGVTYFTAGSYDKALQVWTEIYKTGYRSANLAYNIGNAYFKLNNIPSAILYYERAYLLKPGDENINYNLQVARTLNVDRFQEIPELFFIKWYNFVSLSLSSDTWARFSIITFIIFLLFLSLYIYSARHRNKVFGFWFALLFIFLSLSTLALTVRNKSLVYNSHKAIITSPLISGKSSPDKSGNDLFVLHEGTKVTIEDEVGEWLEIRLSDGNKGWVPGNSIIII
jgi:tetratricopeptide (TPR) repeat protein